ncbi:MAG: prepilin-type N-terminal cleavage/methylation domain-containing protein [Planctomycetota bacterium]
MRRRGRHNQTGFTLLEALLASVLLGAVMMAIASAMSASNKAAFEGQKRILAGLAAGDLMGEIATLPYDDARALDGTVQDVGEMQTLDGVNYPALYWSIGRTVSVATDSITDETLGVTIDGITITVTANDASAELARVELFVAEPDA